MKGKKKEMTKMKKSGRNQEIKDGKREL